MDPRGLRKITAEDRGGFESEFEEQVYKGLMEGNDRTKLRCPVGQYVIGPRHRRDRPGAGERARRHRPCGSPEEEGDHGRAAPREPRKADAGELCYVKNLEYADGRPPPSRSGPGIEDRTRSAAPLRPFPGAAPGAVATSALHPRRVIATPPPASRPRSRPTRVARSAPDHPAVLDLPPTSPTSPPTRPRSRPATRPATRLRNQMSYHSFSFTATSPMLQSPPSGAHCTAGRSRRSLTGIRRSAGPSPAGRGSAARRSASASPSPSGS